MNDAIRKIADDTTRAFAEACYDDNSIADLIDAAEPCEIDMRQWEITANQWREALAAALNDRLHDWVLAYVEGCESNGVDPREAIAEYLNITVEAVEIDDEGDIHAGHWLTIDQLGGLYAWHERTYA